ncbi:MAG: hypothetical protein IH994_05005 [Proteobacteria bacterium]|nr:hypothetical protein [Pseudomonadota bacterium]
MDLTFVSTGKRIGLHPDSEQAVLEMPVWQRHAAYHDTCRKVYAMANPEVSAPETVLAKRGVDLVRGSLTREHAASLSNEITNLLEARGPGGGAHGPITDNPDEVSVRVPYEGALLDMLKDALPLILNPEAEGLLESYYGSYFRIDSTSCNRTHPIDEHTISFLWHRDVAPMAQVHIMVYLTDSGPQKGLTLFLDLEQTKTAAKLGYHYTKVTQKRGLKRDDEGVPERRLHLDDLFEQAGKDLTVNRPDPKAGDSLLFAAPRVLHRGSLPTEGYRDVFLLVLQPSFVPWRQDIEDFGYDHIFTDCGKDTLYTNPFKSLAPALPKDGNSTLTSWEQWIFEGDILP